MNITYRLLTAIIVYVSYGFLFPYQLEKLIEKNYFLHKSAQEAYKAYIRAYDSHSLKQIYDVNNLDLPKVSLSFGFKVPPFVDLSILLPQYFKAKFWHYKCSVQLAEFLWYLRFCCFVVGVGVFLLIIIKMLQQYFIKGNVNIANKIIAKIPTNISFSTCPCCTGFSCCQADSGIHLCSRVLFSSMQNYFH